MRIFLSYAFHDGDEVIAANIERLLTSHGIRTEVGRRLGGEDLTPAIQAKIAKCDACIALMTRRDKIEGEEKWRTHRWVQDELNHARAISLRSIALVEEGVDVGGAYGQHERIPFGRADQLDAFLALSETLSIWKAGAGLDRIARIIPDRIGYLFKGSNSLTCRYRFVTHQGERTAWNLGNPIAAQGGTILHLHGIQSALDQVEVEVLENNRMRWWSEATPQFMAVSLMNPGEDET